MGADKTAGGENAFDRAWSLSWQAAPGRDFLAHESLAVRIRHRLMAAHSQPGRQLLYYVLMPTEIHVVARVNDGETIVSIVRSCSHILSRWVREVHVRRGPVFAAKYHAESLDSRQALRREVLMLAWRPVKLGLCARPMLYANAALNVVVGAKSGDGFDVKPLLAVYGEFIGTARSALEASLRVGPTDEAWRAWELSRGLELPVVQQDLVSAAALPRSVDAAAASLIAAGGSYSVEGALQLLEAWVCAKIASGGGLDAPTGLRRQRVRARALVACLAVDHRVCSAVFVARYYGCTKGTLSVQMSPCRTRPNDRKLLSTPLDRILQDAEVLRTAGLMRRIVAEGTSLPSEPDSPDPSP